ncbi:hypothetical protein ACTXT7_010463 [Hymenolepis weldensis]
MATIKIEEERENDERNQNRTKEIARIGRLHRKSFVRQLGIMKDSKTRVSLQGSVLHSRRASEHEERQMSAIKDEKEEE